MGIFLSLPILSAPPYPLQAQVTKDLSLLASVSILWVRGWGHPGWPGGQAEPFCLEKIVPRARKQPTSKPLWALPRSPMIILCGLLISKLNSIITHCLASWL